MDWVYLEHSVTGGAARFPDEPGVVEWYEAHGWARAEEPAPVPFMPPKANTEPVEAEWVELVHPLAGRGTWPNNLEALQGAHEVGWEFPEPEPEPAAEPEKPVKETVSEKASTEPAIDGDDDIEGVTGG